jgi:hypothetical protein
MGILGSLLGGGVGGGDGAGGTTAQNQAGAGTSTVSVNTGIGGNNGLQNVGSILAILNQGASQNGAVNYQYESLFQSLNPLSSADPYQPAQLVGPNPISPGPSITTILLMVAVIGGIAFIALKGKL